LAWYCKGVKLRREYARQHTIALSKESAMLGLGLIGFLIVGLVAGYIAERMTGRSHTLLQNLLTGVVGAYLGGILFWVLGLQATNIIGALIVATIGAIVLLLIVQRIQR
jgi:uncharacterized membrane protein YeaQ/YmgE (transglycosylase-associated protein family)